MAFDPNTPPTRETLKTLPPLVLDGAWGTELEKLGAQPGEMCDPWNTEHPERVQRVAEAYVEAGAQIVLTNTFSANRITLAKHGLEGRVAEINRAGAEISRRAAQGRAYVFASLGPTGKMVMMGEVTPEAVEAAYAEQAAALIEGGADALVLETMADAVEAEAALRGAVSVAGERPVGVSFTFDSGEGGAFTMMGVSIEQAWALAHDGGASFVGANCGAGIETFPALARRYAACGDALPIWIKGNAGQPELVDGRTVFRATPQVYADAVAPLLAAGARMIGGCCGSTPEHVRAIADRMRNESTTR